MLSDIQKRISNRAGASLKPQHYAEFLSQRQDVGWLEVHAENYMGDGGPALHYLSRMRADYAISLHGVGLSIGGARPLDKAHLRRLKALVKRFEPALFSEHLAWSTHGETYFPDLLPIPYTKSSLLHIASHIDQVQEALGVQMLLENPSRYLEIDESEMTETEFLRELVQRTGCGLLLDINNVVVSANNLDFDARDYLAGFPVEAIGEIHLAGHTAIDEPAGDVLLIDTHDGPVSSVVWALFAECLALSGPIPTLIEWDRDIPSWATLSEEVRRATKLLEVHQSTQTPAASANRSNQREREFNVIAC